MVKHCNTEKWQWNVAIETGQTEPDFQPSIATSPCGKYIYVAGTTYGPAKFHNFKCGVVDTEVAMSSMDFGNDYSQFVAKMTTCGKWLWVATIETEDESDRIFITVDKCGDVVIQLNVRDDSIYSFYNVGATEPSLIATERNDEYVIVAKLSQCGQWRWLSYIVSDGERVEISGRACPITIDNCNNIIVSGDDADDDVPYFYMANPDGSIKDDYTIKGIEGENDQIFLAKMDPCGRWLWAAAVDSYSNEDTPAVVVDRCNNIYFAGDGGDEEYKTKFYHAGPDGNTTKLNPLTGLRSDNDHVFIGKLNPCGKWLWTAAIHASNNGDCYDPCVALDNCDNLVITCAGFYDARPNFHNTDMLGNTSESVAMIGKKSRTYDDDGPNETSQISVAKLSPCGKWIWNASMDSQYNFENAQIVTDRCGDAYVSATHEHNTDYPGRIGLFDSAIDGGVDENPSVVGNGWDNYQVSIGKIDKCGHWKSIYSIKSYYTVDSALAVDKCNNLYVAASTYVEENENNTYTPVGFYQGTNTTPTMSGLQVQDTMGMIVIGKIGKC